MSTNPGDAEQLTELREQVALANRLLHHYGLAAYQGHVSARIPGTDLALIKAQPSVSMSRVRADDLMIIDLDGRIVEATPAYPSVVAGWALHTELYRARPEVRSVCHTHQKWCTLFGIAGRTVLPVLHPPTASVAAEPWPVYEENGGVVADVAQARRVADLLGGNVACHLRGHGMVFVGTTVSKSVLAACDAEQMAELTWQAMAIGTPETISMGDLWHDVEGRFAPPREDVRDGVARGEWGNQVWLDEHPEAAWERGIRL